MSFLSLNGWSVGIADRNAKLRREEVGLMEGRAFSGMQHDTRRAVKRTGQFTTGVLGEDDGDALENLLTGLGWHFPFDQDLYSEDTKLGPSAGYTATLGTTTPTPKFGTRRLSVPSGSTILWPAGLGSNYTVMAWIWNGSSWDHWIRRSDDSSGSVVTTLYKNGVSGQPALYSLTVSGGAVYLSGRNPATNASATTYYDDLVVLPWVASAGQLAAWSSAASPFSPIPKLDLSGDVLREASSIEVRGKVTDVVYEQAMVGGVWQDNARRVSFSLLEV